MARIFNELGVLLELQGENPFKSRAYYNAARTLENLSGDLASLVRTNGLAELPGFGPAITKKVAEWVETGTIRYYEELRGQTPAGLFELLGVPGLGPRKISQIHSALGVTNLEELERACHSDQLAGLPGFGAKTQEKICAGIRFLKDHRGEYLLFEALKLGVMFRERLADHPMVQRVELAGSCRRFKETVKDLDLVVAATDPETVIQFFNTQPEVIQVVASGGTKSSVTLKTGINADLRVVTLAEFPHVLQHFTGSKDHNTALRHLAKQQGYKVNEYGLFRDEAPIYCRDEAEIYRTLGFAYIPPELREDLGELEAAANDQLPELIQPEDLNGLFHIHTTASDGANSLREMVEAAIARGYTYLGVTDHSQAAVYAHGLTPDRLRMQAAEVERLSREYPGFRIFRGIEADILGNGALDYTPAILAEFDFVIGSVHSQFKLTPAEMTARVLKALDNPYLTMLGHPTGRILLGRPGYELDLEAVLTKAAERGIIIEFNANPYRLDLDWRWLRRAKLLGVMTAINPDAHAVSELDLARACLPIARKGWLEPSDVLNTRTMEEVAAYFRGRRGDSPP